MPAARPAPASMGGEPDRGRKKARDATSATMIISRPDVVLCPSFTAMPAARANKAKPTPRSTIRPSSTVNAKYPQIRMVRSPNWT